MLKRRTVAAATLALLLQGYPLTALAVTPADVETAITKAKILASGIGLKAQVNGDQAVVSTYRNAQATDKDCKIDALRIARTVLEQFPALTRVTVYFYNSADQTKFKMVSVSAGDVKAFGANQVSPETILSSLLVNEENASASDGVQATVTGQEVVAAINKAKLLAPGVGVRAQMKGTQAFVSTYRNAQATDKDCKIDSILIARTVIEGMSSNVSRVTIYFYNSSDPTKFKSVSVSAGDVKAFGTQQVSNDALLASLPINEESSSTNLSSYLEGTQTSDHPIEVAIKDDILNLSTQIDSWASSRDCKYQALTLAEKALEAAPATIKKIQVRFADPANSGSVREVSFDPATVKALSNQVDSTFFTLNIVATVAAPQAGDISGLTAVAGVLRDSRAQLLARIQKLAKEGVGVMPYITAFGAIEQQVPGGDETKLSDSIKRLSDALDSQEKAAKAAKEHQTKPVVAQKKSTTPPRITWSPESRWVLGTGEIDTSRVLREPDAYVSEIETRLNAANPRANDNPKFYHALRFFAQTLYEDKQYDAVSKLLDRIAQIQYRHPNFNQ